MFLSAFVLPLNTIWDRLTLALLLLTATVACGADVRPTCFVDLPVYDAKGDRLESKVVAVSINGEGVDLLRSKQDGFRMTADASRLYFSENLIGKRPLDVTVSSEAGKRITRPVVLTACQQRMSLEYGEQDTGFDVGWSVVQGRVSGCRIVGDWWIRAMPMFGGQAGPTFDAYISANDGRFSLACDRGERHIVIIGRGKTPLKVLGVNVIGGGKNDLGTIDISDSCPK